MWMREGEEEDEKDVMHVSLQILELEEGPLCKSLCIISLDGS
jgi:hypothetical protein